MSEKINLNSVAKEATPKNGEKEYRLKKETTKLLSKNAQAKLKEGIEKENLDDVFTKILEEALAEGYIKFETASYS